MPISIFFARIWFDTSYLFAIYTSIVSFIDVKYKRTEYNDIVCSLQYV